jgi:Sec-independent protein translocase protein TatA
MHRGNVCHGDVKPHNALVMPKSRRLKLIDFGMASSLGRARLTGTPEYMAPEVGEQFLRWRGQAETQAESAELDPVAVDMYGLGCLAYDLITNQRPRPTSRSRKEPVTIMEVRDLELHRLKEAMSATPSFDGKLRTQWGRRLPRRVRQLLAATLDRRPEARGTPSALADEIDCYLAHEPLAGERHKIWLRVALWCRRYPSLALLVVGLVGVVILGVFAEHLASNASNADAALSETKRQLVVEQQQVAEEKQRVVSVQQELAKTASKVDAMIDELKKSQIASAERQSVITDLERVRNTLRSEVARKTKTIADKDHEIAKRDGDLSEKELQIQKLNVEYKTAMTRLDAAHAAAIGKLDAAHALAIGKLDAVHALAITRLKSEHEVEIQKLEKKLADSLAVQPGPGVAGAVSGGSNATGSGAAGSGALGETGSGATGSGAAGSGTLGGTASGAAGSGAEGSSDRGSASILPSSGGG